MRIAISSGHGKYISGAVGPSPWGLNEHKEAVKVVNRLFDLLNASGVGTVKFEDTTSKTQNENLKTIVNWHNRQTRDLDISIHFNCYQSTDKPMGTECLYVTQQKLSADVAAGIASASGLINRGAKKRTDLYFLNNTAKPAILVEVCFVDSKADVNIYNTKFEQICGAISQAVGGGQAPAGTKPTIRKGDYGPYVKELQLDLNEQLEGCNLVADSDFGSQTDQATKMYQYSRGLSVDGICGPNTWAALDAEAPPIPPPEAMLSPDDIAAITQIAQESSIYRYSWKDRGVAPPGYTIGMALAFAITHLQLGGDVSWAVQMAKANTHNSDKDALSWYAGKFDDLGMNNDQSGPDTLRHLWVLMLGLGMRESSGRHCEGRDQSASNVSSDTAEAGLFQQSWNSSNSTPEMPKEMNFFDQDQTSCFLQAFKQGVSCSSSEWSCYGSGTGYHFQELCKSCPTYAAQSCASGLRTIRQHWGPINRYEAEVKSAADDMFKQVQDYLDEPEVA